MYLYYYLLRSTIIVTDVHKYTYMKTLIRIQRFTAKV